MTGHGIARWWLAASLTWLVLIFAGTAHAADASKADAAFVAANAAYEAGRYEEAVAAYEGVLAEGWQSGPLYYNLGGAYYRAGRLGQAVLSYRRALRLMPRDADLGANLRLAASRVRTDASIKETAPQGMYALAEATGGMSAGGIAWAASLALSAGLILVAAAIAMPRVRRVALAGALAAGLMGLAAGWVAYERWAIETREAVVTARQAVVRFEPHEGATVHFTLYEGAVAYVLEDQGSVWVRVGLAGGQTGWTEAGWLQRVM